MPNEEVIEKEVAINYRIHFEISSLKSTKTLEITVTKPHWRMMVEHGSKMKCSNLYAAKDEMVETT